MPSFRFGPIARILCVLALVASASAQAQPEWLGEGYLLDRWTNADGLPVNGTTDVLIGPDGYLWLATFDGLVRFDGHRFKTFNASHYPGLPGNRLTRLIQQASGPIWVLTEQYALASFDGRAFHAAGTDQGLPARRVLKLHLDADDRLWAGTEKGLARACGKACFRAVSDDRLAGEAVQAFADAPDGGLWVGTGSGEVLRVGLDGVRNTFGADAGLALRDVRALAVDQHGTLFAGGAGGLASIRADRARMLPAFDEETINDLEVAPDGDLIVQSYERTWRLDDGAWRVVNEGPIAGYVRLAAVGPQGASWRVRQYGLLKNGEPVVDAPCPIRDFTFDSTGAVWLATLCDGLWRIRERRFETITVRDGLPEGPVYGMAQSPDGRIWASAGTGLVAEIRAGSVRRLYPTGSPGQVLGTVAVDRGERVLAGKGGLCVISGTGCEAPAGMPDALETGLVRSVFADRDGGLWVGIQTGLWRRQGGRWEPMQAQLDLPEWVQVQVIYQARSGNLWFGTDSSGLRRRSGNGRVLALGLKAGLASNRIRDLHEDERGYLWVVTADSGLCRSDRPEHEPGLRFDCLDKSQGLYADSLHRLLPDDHGRYWFNSNTGVFWVHRDALERVLDGRFDRVYPRVYTERDGLPDREGNGGVQNAGIRLNDGRLAFPGQGGIVVFDPDRVQELAGIPRVVPERIDLPGGTALPAEDRVRLPLGERVFSVRFTGIQPGLTGQTYFRYRMNGRRWVEIGDDRNLSFDGIRPGKHNLEIAAVDADSGLSGPVTRMAIVVPAFLYERTEVRGALLAMFAAIVAFWLLRRRRVAIRLQQYLHREVERRTVDVLRQQRVAERESAADAGPARELAPARGRAPARAESASPLADKVREWVESSVHEGDISVVSLAETLHMSRSKLHRRLVDETGRSPGDFIRDVRLGMARQLLQDNAMSVSDVAFSVGFSSVSGFSRAYRSHFGESPSKTVN